MVTLNDYLYSGDTIFKIIQNYMTDLRKEGKRTHNETTLCIAIVSFKYRKCWSTTIS